MHAPVVVTHLDVLAHVVWLRIFPKSGIVISCPWVQQIAQPIAVETVLPTTLSDSPVSLIYRRSFSLLSDKFSEHVRNTFIEGARLAVVFKRLLFFRHTMCYFMSNDI